MSDKLDLAKLEKVCPEAKEMADCMQLDDEDRENGMDDDTPCVCITPKDAKAIATRLLALAAENERLKELLGRCDLELKNVIKFVKNDLHRDAIKTLRRVVERELKETP